MSGDNRVFITGRSALTATGSTADDTWNAILSGQSGIEELKQWDLSAFEARLGGELKEFQPARMLPDRKLVKVISRQDIIGINAAVQAVEDSQMLSYRDSLSSDELFNGQTAVYVGSPGNKYYQQYDFLPLMAKTQRNIQNFATHLFEEVHPMWLLRILPNNVLAYTGITYGFKGPNHNITNHAVGGAQAIIEAYHAIRNGQAERAVVIGYDVAIEPQALFYYDKLGVISRRHLKPFDIEHDGTILAEGAAALVLESESSVKSRSAKCYGEMLIGKSSTEAAGLFSLESDGKPLSDLIHTTLNAAALTSDQISCIVAHGNGNKKSDESEFQAIQSIFSQNKTPVTAFKWSMGHTVCASGIVDTVLSTYTLQTKIVPGISNLNQIAASCDGLNVTDAQRTIQDDPCVLVINRGFSSMNACLVIKTCE